jgi:hypothetical protein
MALKNRVQDATEAAPPAVATAPRLGSVERIALQHLASAHKPWDGQRADSVPAARSALTRLLSLGLVRSVMGEALPAGIQDDTLLWVTPAGRETLTRTKAKTPWPTL